MSNYDRDGFCVTKDGARLATGQRREDAEVFLAELLLLDEMLKIANSANTELATKVSLLESQLKTAAASASQPVVGKIKATKIGGAA